MGIAPLVHTALPLVFLKGFVGAIKDNNNNYVFIKKINL
jgi:hypothetical protein